MNNCSPISILRHIMYMWNDWNKFDSWELAQYGEVCIPFHHPRMPSRHITFRTFVGVGSWGPGSSECGLWVPTSSWYLYIVKIGNFTWVLMPFLIANQLYCQKLQNRGSLWQCPWKNCFPFYGIYCHVPPTIGLQDTVAWGHGWRANKHAGTARWLKPPTLTLNQTL